MKFVIINNQLLDEAKAVVSVADRGFRYGDSVFETIAVHGGVPYQFDWHMERLRKGLHAIRINANLHSLHEQSRRLLRENKVSQGVLRIQVSRGIGSHGYLPDSKHPKAGTTIVIETLPLPAIPESPVTLWMSGYRKISPRSLPVQYKLGQGLNSTLARIEAAERQCFDALLLNHEEQVCETASGNIFWIKDNTLFTPALHCGVLEGSMRATAMRLASLPVREVSATLEDLAAAECVFITNALWKIVPVGRLDPAGTSWKPSSAIGTLKGLIESDINSYTLANSGRW